MNSFNLNPRTKGSNDEYIDESINGAFGENVAPALLLSAAILDVSNYNESASYAQKYGTKSLSSSPKYGPLIPVKWSQKYVGNNLSDNVFNKYTPNNYPAGCVIIAVAQILLTNTNFTYNSIAGYNCYRNTMLTVANYTSPNSPGTSYAQLQAGQFVSDLGSSSILCNATYRADGTSATSYGAKRTLEAFMYNDVTKDIGFGSSNQNKATLQIRNGRPVYFQGDAPGLFQGGHAWVLDGEWGDYYHINWGWRGIRDGYYAKGVFDTAQRYSTDSTYDNGVFWDYPTTEKYTWYFKMITYSL